MRRAQLDKYPILVIDGKQSNLDTLLEIHQKAAIKSVTARRGESGLEKWRDSTNIGLVLVNISLPDMSGAQVCRYIRTVASVPILVFSCQNSAEIKLEAFRAGADDYLVKPFGANEYLARINALLRRVQLKGAGSHLQLHFDRLAIDPSSGRASVMGEKLDLSPLEFRLLVYMVKHHGQTLSYDKLLEDVWDDASRGYKLPDRENMVQVAISRLRSKLDTHEAQTKQIQTMHGIGYRIDVERYRSGLLQLTNLFHLSKYKQVVIGTPQEDRL